MEVKNHRIDEIWFKSSSNLSSGTINPRFIVNHYTAGWSGTGARNWLLGAAGGTGNRGSSAHVIIDRDGTAWQIANFNRKSWHAGPSRYGTVTGLNSHSIGLEFVNPGFMKSDGSGGWLDSNGRRMTEQQLNDKGGFIQAKHPIVGSGTYAWPVYTPEQLETGRQITLAIIDKYDIADIITHEEIDTRGWKTDPGPAFPQEEFKDLLGHNVDEDTPASSYRVSATRLNFRGGPSTDADKIEPPGALTEGTVVEIERKDGVWAFVVVTQPPAGGDGIAAGMRGWVHSGYIDRVF